MVLRRSRQVATTLFWEVSLPQVHSKTEQNMGYDSNVWSSNPEERKHDYCPSDLTLFQSQKPKNVIELLLPASFGGSHALLNCLYLVAKASAWQWALALADPEGPQAIDHLEELQEGPSDRPLYLVHKTRRIWQLLEAPSAPVAFATVLRRKGDFAHCEITPREIHNIPSETADLFLSCFLSFFFSLSRWKYAEQAASHMNHALVC